jgi:DNA-binding NtrC family response regulator
MNLQIKRVQFTVRIRSHKCTFSYIINTLLGGRVFNSKYRSREIIIAVSEKTNILIIDDDKDILSACQVLLKRHFDEVVTCREPRDIPSLMAAQDFHAIMLDMNFSPGASSGEEGLQWLGNILEIDRDAVVIMVTAFSSVGAAVEAMKLGAHDFIEKPWNNDRLTSTLTAAVRLRRSKEETQRFRQQNRILTEDVSRRHQPIIGQSDAINDLLSVIRKAAPTDANVLIIGENGTGKELVAHEIHALSRRSEQAFITVDLGTVPSTLLDSELFGHKKGAFTDAREDRMGRFQAANKGTFFLDEIGNLPLSLQPKLLQALETRKVTPLGSSRAEPIDIRLVSATNVTHEELRNPEIFRPDLLYRLNTVEIYVPALRERVDDVPLLANTFVREYSRKYNRHIDGISNQAMKLLMDYSWPGNVRELRYCIERAIILADGHELDEKDFTSLVEIERLANEPSSAVGQTLDDMEKVSIEQVLKKNQGNISHAARELGLTRASLYRRIEKFGL